VAKMRLVVVAAVLPCTALRLQVKDPTPSVRSAGFGAFAGTGSIYPFEWEKSEFDEYKYPLRQGELRNPNGAFALPKEDHPRIPFLGDGDINPVAPENQPYANGNQWFGDLTRKPLKVPGYLYPDLFPGEGKDQTYSHDQYFQELCGRPPPTTTVSPCDESDTTTVVTTTTAGTLPPEPVVQPSSPSGQEAVANVLREVQAAKPSPTKDQAPTMKPWIPGNTVPHRDYAGVIKGMKWPWEMVGDASLVGGIGAYPARAVEKDTDFIATPEPEKGPCIATRTTTTTTTTTSSVQISIPTPAPSTTPPATTTPGPRQVLCARLARDHQKLLAPYDRYGVYPLAAPESRNDNPLVAPKDWVPEDVARFVDQVHDREETLGTSLLAKGKKP